MTQLKFHLPGNRETKKHTAQDILCYILSLVSLWLHNPEQCIQINKLHITEKERTLLSVQKIQYTSPFAQNPLIIEPRRKKTNILVSTWSDTNQDVQLH